MEKQGSFMVEQQPSEIVISVEELMSKVNDETASKENAVALTDNERLTPKKKTNDPQGKKWQLTINNPLEKGFDHDRIKLELQSLKSLVYFCMVDEQGNEETHHTHVFVAFTSNVRFSTIKNLFPPAHLERVNGSCADNRTYLLKEGKWAGADKADTTIEGTFEEWGEMPSEKISMGGISIEAMIIERILEGASNAEILIMFPHYLRGMRDVEHVRQMLRAEENRHKWRQLETTYIWGATGAGKTRSVMDTHEYSNVYAVNNYQHPFDGYAGENVLLLDEFYSKFRLQDMNNYLDGYPLPLPARYSNKIACYNRVYIVSNLDLIEQYTYEQQAQPEVWAAFLRRIHKIIRFTPDVTRLEYSTKDYLAGNSGYKDYNNAFIELTADTPTPFENTEQLSLTERA